MTSYQESDSASRNDQSQGVFGCLVPLIASTVFLAVAVTLISWFVLSDDEDDQQVVDEGADAVSASEEPAPSAGNGDLFEDLVADGDESGASSEALLEVVRSAKWKEFGQPEVFDLGSELRVQHKFRRQDEQIRVTIHSLKSEPASQAVLEETEMPARAVQFDSRVIVIEPITDGSKAAIDPLTDRLRRFRDLLDEQEDAN